MPGNAAQRVADVLDAETRYRTAAQLAAAAGCSTATVRMLLHQLRESGELDTDASDWPFGYRLKGR